MIPQLDAAEAETIGLDLAGHIGWRWLPGVLARSGVHELRVCEVRGRELHGWPAAMDPPWIDSPGVWPDLRDAATFGVLLQVWQLLPGHRFQTPCMVMVDVALEGVGGARAVRALARALMAEMGATP